MSLLNMFRANEIVSDKNDTSQEVECTDGVIPHENAKKIFFDVRNIINKAESKIQYAKRTKKLNNKDFIKKLQDNVTAAGERMSDLCYEIKINEKLIHFK